VNASSVSIVSLLLYVDMIRMVYSMTSLYMYHVIYNLLT